jgi:hypothetical protein
MGYFFLPPIYLLPFPEELYPPDRFDPLRFAALASPRGSAKPIAAAKRHQAKLRRLRRSEFVVSFI